MSMSIGSSRWGRWRMRCLASLVALAMLGFLALAPNNASAQSSGIRIGIGGGVLGTILNSKTLGGSTSKKKSASSRSSGKSSASAKKKKSSVASKSKSKSKRSRKNDDDEEQDTAARDDKADDKSAETHADEPAEKTDAHASKDAGTSPPQATPVNAPAAQAVAPPVTEPVITSASEIKAAQQHLKYMGYDVPSADGALDLKTKIAVMQFQHSLGAPTTGTLTVQQLRTLFSQAVAKQGR
jgi:hypothetical protein